MSSKPATEMEATTEPTLTQKMPIVPFKVLHVGIPFFKDEKCTEQVPGVTLAIIQALDPDDEIQELDIVPTRLVYSPGQYVTMALDNKELWEDSWFRDPASGEIQKAFQIHVKFVGEVIDPKIVDAEKATLQDLERRTAEKIQQIAQAKAEEPSVN
ncbi:MAG: hypothetical protein JSU96_11000 [Acidobacteriota bacterium]|nr:MAG: hypothetical protein JSU96_11000 [Acidobacteriota bacterium]